MKASALRPRRLVRWNVFLTLLPGELALVAVDGKACARIAQVDAASAMHAVRIIWELVPRAVVYRVEPAAWSRVIRVVSSRIVSGVR